MKQTHRTFNTYWIQRLLITSIFILASTLLYAQCYVSPTKYDYSTLAKSITKNAKSKLEKNRAIFNWICENIAYDTSYTIYTADECYEQKKGVCQAYSELYYRLCEAVGIKCIIISGKTKDYTVVLVVSDKSGNKATKSIVFQILQRFKTIYQHFEKIHRKI